MKKVAFAILGIWSAISCFFSPVWVCGWDITGFVTGTAEGEQALKQITQLEKGTVIPENIPQGGCRFTVTLIG